MALELTIYNLAGDTWSVAANRNWDLHDLKLAIELASGVPFYEQHLVVGTTELSAKLPLNVFAECQAAELNLLSLDF